MNPSLQTQLNCFTGFCLLFNHWSQIFYQYSIIIKVKKSSWLITELEKKDKTLQQPSETIKLGLRTGIRRRWLFIRNRLDGCLLFTQSLLAIEKKYLKFWRCKSVQNWSLVNAKFTYILRPRIFELINIQYWRLEILCIFMTKILA